MIEEFANVNFEGQTNEKGEVDMCKGMELYMIETAIKLLRDAKYPEEKIVENVAKSLNVSIESVEELMTPKAV